MAFKDLREFVDKASIDLPIDGTVYTVYDVDAETGLWAQSVLEVGAAAYNGQDLDGAELLDDDAERGVYQRLLAGTFDQMCADGVAWNDIKHASITALVWITVDEESATRYWESGGTPGEAQARPAPNRASRRASAAVVKKTRKPASTSGTRVSKSTKARPGTRSSSSGS